MKPDSPDIDWIEEPKLGKLEQCWEPGPAAGVRFTDEERRQVHAPKK